MATIKDVARLAGVSTATVSATLNKTAYVSPMLQERVQGAVEALSYAPSTVARSLKMGRTKMLGLVISDITNSFFSELVHSVEAAAHRQGYTVLLGHSDEDVRKEVELLRVMQAQRVDGVILAPSGQPADYQRAGIKSYPVPLTLLDRVVAPFEADAVLIDNYTAAFSAARYLIAHGHRLIGTIAGPDVTTGAERLAGFLAALDDAGLPVDRDYIAYGSFRQEAGQAALRRIMALPEPPTALFVANSEMLVGAMLGLAELGLQCPRDVSLIAVDDMPWMKAFSPRMTVLKQPIRQMGEAVMDLMLGRLTTAVGAAPRRMILQSTLVERDSVQAPVAVPVVGQRKAS